MEPEVTIDGHSYPISKLEEKQKEAENSGAKLVEIKEGVWKTLKKLEG